MTTFLSLETFCRFNQLDLEIVYIRHQRHYFSRKIKNRNGTQRSLLFLACVPTFCVDYVRPSVHATEL